MIVKRTVKFNIKKSHTDYKYIKTQLIESKEIYNFANYILRQFYFKNSKNHKYSLNFIEEYPTLKDLFLSYIDKNKQFTTLFYKIICEFAKLKKYSINLKIVQNIVDKLKNYEWEGVYLVGSNFAKTQSPYPQYETFEAFKEVFPTLSFNNCLLLIKGSRGMALERLIQVK